MKALKYILYSLLIIGVLTLLLYQGVVSKDLEKADLVKGILIIAAAILGMVKPSKKRIANKKAVYQKAYAEHILGAFEDDPKLERKFYNAVDDYHQNKLSSAITKLEQLRPHCQRSADLRAVTVFTALCLDDMHQYAQAIEQYRSAISMRPNASLYSNMGLCHMRLGNYTAAEQSYRTAISIDPKNAFAYNNLSALFLRQSAYPSALEYALQAIEINGSLPQALSTAAICYGILGDEENYEKYYRMAVTNGYDGQKIRSVVNQLR